MKNIFFTIILFTTHLYHAQSWVDVGLKGSWGANFLLNGNLFQDNSYNHKLSFGYAFGGKIGLNFNQNHEITFDVMAGKFKQGFTYSVEDTIMNIENNYTSEIGFSKIDFILMYRHNKDGSYFEFGPCIALVGNPYFTDSRPFSPEQVSESYFNLNNKGLVLGFGSYIIGTENFGITTGIRITKYLDDLITKEGKNNTFFTYKNYETYKSYTPLFIEFIMEANFDFAYVAKAKCGRKKIIFF